MVSKVKLVNVLVDFPLWCLGLNPAILTENNENGKNMEKQSGEPSRQDTGMGVKSCYWCPWLKNKCCLLTSPSAAAFG